MADWRVKIMDGFDRDKFIDEQRKSWDSAAAGWKKWDRWLDSNMAPLDALLLKKARVREGAHVLDLGSGTGYPAIRAARRVGEKGRVAGFDLSAEMLSVAREKLRDAGLSNAVFHACDVSAIPCGDGEFDAATSRFCLMFLPRLDHCLVEARRALKTGARLAAAVWAGPEKNPSMSLPMGVLKEFLETPPPDPSAPGLFSLGRPGALRERMEKAGFHDTREEAVPVEWRYASARQYADMLRDMAAPMRAMFEKLEPPARAAAEQKMMEAVEKFRDADGITIPGEAIIVSGAKGSA